MSSIARMSQASALISTLAICPQVLSAQGFDGAQFLEWSDAAQDGYIQTSVTMAAIIATKTSPPTGDCIDDWYLAPTARIDARNEQVKATIERNIEYHPSAVIYLILEQECGSFAD